MENFLPFIVQEKIILGSSTVMGLTLCKKGDPIMQSSFRSSSLLRCRTSFIPLILIGKFGTHPSSCTGVPSMATPCSFVFS